MAVGPGDLQWDEAMTESDTNPTNGRTDKACDCCGGHTETNVESEHSHARWLGDTDPLAARLPDDLRSGLGRLLGGESVDTIGEWVAAIRDRVGDGSIDSADLCHADGETAHRAEVGGQTYHFICFYDAVVLAALTDGAVDIRTESPDGTVVEAHAAGTDRLQVTPETAVFSFGVAESVDPPGDGEPSHEALYAAVCPAVKAFPDRAAYERWADSAGVATVATPLAGATDLASALVD